MKEFKTNEIYIPKGGLALDPSKIKKKKSEIAEALAKGKPVEIGNGGDVSGKNQTEMLTKHGKLALDPSKIKKKKSEVAEALAKGKPVEIGNGGDVSGKNQTEMLTKHGKLAAQWWEYDKQRLNDEIDLMKQSAFRNFELIELNDGSLAWEGILKPGLCDGVEWHVIAVYNHNFPTPTMGGSLRVYPIEPSYNDIVSALGYHPHHMLRDMDGDWYLCTTRAGDLANDANLSSSAVTVLGLAVKWLAAFELVMEGELDAALFNQPDGI